MLVFRQALVAGEYPNARSLARKLEVSLRTAQRDIEYVRDQLGWDIDYDKERRGYFARGRLEFPQPALTEGDLLAVLVAMPIVARYRGTAYGNRLKNLFEKLSAGLPQEVDLRLSELDAALQIKTSGVPLVDPDVLDTIQDGIRTRRTLACRYQTRSRGGEISDREIDPYHLCCSDGLWYMVGRCHLRKAVLTFAVWRFLDVSLTARGFRRPAGFDPSKYFANSFRVFCGAGAQRVAVRLSGLSAELLSERPAPAEEGRRILKDGRLEIRLQVSGLQEVLWWVLGFGGECEVVRPKRLRELVLEHASLMVHRYSSTRRRDRRPVRRHSRAQGASAKDRAAEALG